MQAPASNVQTAIQDQQPRGEKVQVALQPHDLLLGRAIYVNFFNVSPVPDRVRLTFGEIMGSQTQYRFAVVLSEPELFAEKMRVALDKVSSPQLSTKSPSTSVPRPEDILKVMPIFANVFNILCSPAQVRITFGELIKPYKPAFHSAVILSPQDAKALAQEVLTTVEKMTLNMKRGLN